MLSPCFVATSRLTSAPRQCLHALRVHLGFHHGGQLLVCRQGLVSHIHGWHPEAHACLQCTLFACLHHGVCHRCRCGGAGCRLAHGDIVDIAPSVLFSCRCAVETDVVCSCHASRQSETEFLLHGRVSVHIVLEIVHRSDFRNHSGGRWRCAYPHLHSRIVERHVAELLESQFIVVVCLREHCSRHESPAVHIPVRPVVFLGRRCAHSLVVSHIEPLAGGCRRFKCEHLELRLALQCELKRHLQQIAPLLRHGCLSGDITLIALGRRRQHTGHCEGYRQSKIGKESFHKPTLF